MSIRVVKFSMEFNIERIYKAIKLYSKGDITLPYKYLHYYFKTFDASSLSRLENHLEYELGLNAGFCLTEHDRYLWENVFLQGSCCCDDIEGLVEKVLISYKETKQDNLPKKWKDFLELRQDSTNKN